jgi:hypothetical protein
MQLALHVPPVQEHILTLLRSIASSQVSLSLTGGTSSSSVPYRSSMAVIAVPRTFSWLMRSMSVTTRTTTGSFCNSLAEARSLQGVWLRVFLTSRSEIPIRYGFNQIQDAERQDFVLHSISPSIIDHDISIFLEYNLSLIGQDDAQEPGWPGLEAIRPLAETASGLFMWAATACRFIREGLSTEERLHMLLEGGNAPATPEEHVHGIYITILRNSIQPGYIDQERQRLYGMLRQQLGSIVALFAPLLRRIFEQSTPYNETTGRPDVKMPPRNTRCSKGPEPPASSPPPFISGLSP